jgi:hypothetical protein
VKIKKEIGAALCKPNLFGVFVLLQYVVEQRCERDKYRRC